MTGCFGNDKEDSYMENKLLNEMLDEENLILCDNCETVVKDEDDLIEVAHKDFNKGTQFICEKCLDYHSQFYKEVWG